MNLDLIFGCLTCSLFTDIFTYFLFPTFLIMFVINICRNFGSL